MPAQRVILIGPPASGKGTQAQKIISLLKVESLGTGQLLREEIEKRSKIGEIAASFINKGEYVPDQLIMEMVEQWLSQDSQANGWLLDGFPRTLPQAQLLNSLSMPDLVISLEVPREVLEDRIIMRRECSSCGSTVSVSGRTDVELCPVCSSRSLTSRSDDAVESFKIRYKSYTELTKPLSQFYKSKGILVTVDGTQSPDVVSSQIEKIIKSS